MMGIFEEALLLSMAKVYEGAPFKMDKKNLRSISQSFSESMSDLESSSEDVQFLNSFCLPLSDFESKMLLLLDKGYLEYMADNSTEFMQISNRGWSFLKNISQKAFYGSIFKSNTQLQGIIAERSHTKLQPPIDMPFQEANSLFTFTSTENEPENKQSTKKGKGKGKKGKENK